MFVKENLNRKKKKKKSMCGAIDAAINVAKIPTLIEACNTSMQLIRAFRNEINLKGVGATPLFYGIEINK